MKKSLLLLSLLSLSICGYSQISISHRADAAPAEKKVFPYDTTKNWLGAKHVESYVGQKLYVKGNSLPHWGYDGFKKERESDSRWGAPAASSEFNTRYEDLVEKTFIVKEVHQESRYYLIEYGHWWFLLENINNPDETVWYKYNSQFEHTFPFITLSYYEYLKHHYIGKELISGFTYNTDGELRTAFAENDFITGEPLNPSKDAIWTVTDVTIEDKYYYLVFLLDDKSGHTGSVHVECLGRDGWYSVMEKEEYDKLCIKYDSEYVDLARQGKIRVGMPVELLIKSWGEPEKINKNSTGRNQWIYESGDERQYVYVENDKIVAWN